MANLYELSSNFKNLLDIVESDATNADLPEEEVIFEALSLAGMELDEKIENIVKYIKNLTSDSLAIKQEEMALTARRKAKERKVASLKTYLLLNGVHSWESSCGKVTSRKSTSVNITDADIIPSEYCKVRETVTPDKTAIKASIKAGNVVAGASIVENISIGVK